MDRYRDTDSSFNNDSHELYSTLNEPALSAVKDIVQTHLSADKLMQYAVNTEIVTEGEVQWVDVGYNAQLVFTKRKNTPRDDTYIVVSTIPTNVDDTKMVSYYLNFDNGAFMVSAAQLDDAPSGAPTDEMILQSELIGRSGAAKPDTTDIRTFFDLIDSFDRQMTKHAKQRKGLFGAVTSLFSRK